MHTTYIYICLYISTEMITEEIVTPEIYGNPWEQRSVQADSLSHTMVATTVPRAPLCRRHCLLSSLRQPSPSQSPLRRKQCCALSTEKNTAVVATQGRNYHPSQPCMNPRPGTIFTLWAPTPQTVVCRCCVLACFQNHRSVATLHILILQINKPLLIGLTLSQTLGPQLLCAATLWRAVLQPFCECLHS